MTTLNELKKVGNFENTKIGFSKRSFNGNTENFLVVTLLNSNELPENKTELRNLAKKALNFTFNNIENETIYDKYEVVFENEKGTLIKKTFKAKFQFDYTEIINE